MAAISCVAQCNVELPPVASMGFWANRSVHSFDEDSAATPTPKSGKTTPKAKTPKNSATPAAKKITTILNMEQTKAKVSKTEKMAPTTTQSWDRLLASKREAMAVKKCADVGDDIRWDVLLAAMKEMGPGAKIVKMPAKAKDDGDVSDSNDSTSAGEDEQFSDCSSDRCEAEAWEDALEVAAPSYSVQELLKYRPKVGFVAKTGLHAASVEEKKPTPSAVTEKIKSAPWRKGTTPKSTPTSTPVVPSLPPPPGLAPPPGLTLP